MFPPFLPPAHCKELGGIKSKFQGEHSERTIAIVRRRHYRHGEREIKDGEPCVRNDVGLSQHRAHRTRCL